MIHGISLYGVVWTRFLRDWELFGVRVHAGGDIGVGVGSTHSMVMARELLVDSPRFLALVRFRLIKTRLESSIWLGCVIYLMAFNVELIGPEGANLSWPSKSGRHVSSVEHSEQQQWTELHLPPIAIHMNRLVILLR